MAGSETARMMEDTVLVRSTDADPRLLSLLLKQKQPGSRVSDSLRAASRAGHVAPSCDSEY